MECGLRGARCGSGLLDPTLQDWASRATDDELDAGPSLADLGGTEAVLAEADRLATGPLLPYLDSMSTTHAAPPSYPGSSWSVSCRSGRRQPGERREDGVRRAVRRHSPCRDYGAIDKRGRCRLSAEVVAAASRHLRAA